jgi:uncharacterized protein YjbI with pentapeptide repeats
VREVLDALRPYWPALLALLVLVAAMRHLRGVYRGLVADKRPATPEDRDRKLLAGAQGSMVWSVGRWMAAAAILGGATGYGLYVLLGSPRLPSSNSFSTTELLELLKIGLAVVGGLGAVVALSVAYRKQQVSEAAHLIATRQEERDRTKFYNERYGAAAEQLGHERFAVRLAGVHAMVSLADDWPAQRQICVDVLCAYLRTPVPEDDPNEREVRHVVLTTLLEHDWPDGLDAQPVTVDLRNAQLVDLDMANRVFKGTFVFDNAVFSGERTSFRGTDFLGRTTFRGATFAARETTFQLASVEKAVVDFSGATFAGGSVDFTGVRITLGTLRFARAGLDGAAFDFGNADVSASDISFEGARLRGAALSFKSARLGGRRGWTGRLRLDSVDAEDSTIDLTSCRFPDAVVDVRDARFASCRLEHRWLDIGSVDLVTDGAEPADFVARLRRAVRAEDPEALGTDAPQ